MSPIEPVQSRDCEYCKRLTNAAQRRCCEAGQAVDRANARANAAESALAECREQLARAEKERDEARALLGVESEGAVWNRRERDRAVAESAQHAAEAGRLREALQELVEACPPAEIILAGAAAKKLPAATLVDGPVLYAAALEQAQAALSAADGQRGGADG